MIHTIDSLFLKPQIVQSQYKIAPNSKLLFIGSCFSENVGSHLNDLQFDTTINPFGIAFNPYSLNRQTEYAHQGWIDTNTNIVSTENIFYHLDFHSSIYGHSDRELVENINDKITTFNSACTHFDWVFITLGTSWVYEVVTNHKIVCNCHKQSASHFDKRLLKYEEINTALRGLISYFKSKSKDINIVFTVSPVRHAKDGLWENNISKGLLHRAIFDMVIEDERLQYFPSYELIVDVLRDYRFYKSDHLHPNQVAVDHVVSQLIDAYFAPSTKEFYQRMKSYKALSNHMPKAPSSEAKDKRQSLLLQKWSELKETYPHLH